MDHFIHPDFITIPSVIIENNLLKYLCSPSFVTNKYERKSPNFKHEIIALFVLIEMTSEKKIG